MINNKIRTDEFQNTKLTDSIFKVQLDHMRTWCLGISNNELLYQFRIRSGAEAAGHGLGGWYGRQGFIFGQVFSYLAKLYRATGDLRCREKLYQLIEEWGKCILEDGYALWPDYNKFKRYSIAYEYEKLITGLVDAYEYAGYEMAEKYISKMVDWGIANLTGCSREGTFLGEWYTLGEGLLRAYRIWNKQKYKDFADQWIYDDLWDRFMEGKVTLTKPRHAYSTVNSMSSAAQQYITTGSTKYLEIMEAAYDDFTDNHIFATGGYGPQEDIFGKPGYLGDSLKSAWDKTLTSHVIRSRHDPEGSCEAACCAWAVFKFCKYLQCLTGKAKYGDWMEKAIYNMVLPMPQISEDGKVMYFANYYLDGAVKSNLDRRYHFTPDFYNDLGIGIHQSWQCCTGTLPQDVTEYGNLCYYHDEEGIYINQYVPSCTAFETAAGSFKIQCITSYPEENKIRFIMFMEQPAKCKVRFRIPSWVKETIRVKINGGEIKVNGEAGEWALVERIWEDRDYIEIELPMLLRFEPVDSVHPNLCALCYGPIVLAANDQCLFTASKECPEAWIEKKEGVLEFETIPGCVEGYDFVTRKFIPYYKVPEMQWYFMYCRFQ